MCRLNGFVQAVKFVQFLR